MFDESTSTSPRPSISTTGPCGERSDVELLVGARLAEPVELGAERAVELEPAALTCASTSPARTSASTGSRTGLSAGWTRSGGRPGRRRSCTPRPPRAARTPPRSRRAAISSVISGRRSTTPLSSSQRVLYQVAKIRRPLSGEHVEVLEDQRLGDVDLDRARRDAEQHHAAAVARDPERVGDRARRAGHLEDDVEAVALVALAEPRRRRPASPRRSTVACAPIVSASASRNGVRSEASTTAAPDARAIAIVNRPIGPQPSTATERPARSCSLGREDGVAERLLQRRDLGRQLRAVVLPDHRLRARRRSARRRRRGRRRGSASARTCAPGRCGTGSTCRR